jgi:hypothetical protein
MLLGSLIEVKFVGRTNRLSGMDTAFEVSVLLSHYLAVASTNFKNVRPI